MSTRTVQQLFNLKPEELNALTVLSGLEGFRGEGGRDVAAVAANVLARRLKGNWGGVDVRNIAKSPGQYVAVDNYTMEQLADPTFGARVLGGEAEFNRLRNIVNDPSLVGEQFRQSKGAQSFRGVSAYKNKKPTDYMPIPGKSNFYFNPLDPKNYQKGMNLFGNTGATQVPQNTAATSQNTAAASLLNAFKMGLMGQVLSPMGSSELLSAIENPRVPVDIGQYDLAPRSPYLDALTSGFLK